MTEQTALAGFPKGEFYGAAADGDVKTVCTFLSRLPGYPNNMDETHFKIFVGALTWAATNGHVGVTAEMLAKLNTSDQVLTAVTVPDGDGGSAMTLAAGRGHVGVMTVMLEKLNADQVLTAVTAWDVNGWSAMTRAAANGRADVMMAMVRAAEEKGAGAAQMAEMFLKKDRKNKNAIERMSQETLAAVWEKLPEEVQSQLIADDRFPADKKTSVLTGELPTPREAFAQIAGLQTQVAALEEALAAAQGELDELKAAGQGNGGAPKPGQG